MIETSIVAASAHAQLVELQAQCAHPTGPRGMDALHKLDIINWSLQREVLHSIPSGARVLEIGFGGGGFMRKLHEQGRAASWLGVDISQTAVAALDLPRGVSDYSYDAMCCDAQWMPDLLTDAYDIVVALNVVYYWRDPYEVFKELYRVLAQNGQMILGCMTPPPKPAEFEFARHRQPRFLMRQMRAANFFDVEGSELTEMVPAVVGDTPGVPYERTYNLIAGWKLRSGPSERVRRKPWGV